MSRFLALFARATNWFSSSRDFAAKDSLALSLLAPLPGAYLPWTKSSIRPSALVTVLNDIVINRRAVVVECGGGISTLYIARLLRRVGGHLFTFDHDEDWAQLLRGMLEREGLADVVTITHAPMDASPHALEGNQWYSVEALENALPASPIGLLLVDGPLAFRREIRLARYPALPFFLPRLADNCTVILDDINRKGEQIIASMWARELGVPFEFRPADGGIAIARRNQQFNF